MNLVPLVVSKAASTVETYSAVVANGGGFDPDITPNGDAPFMPTFKWLAGMSVGAIIVFLILMLAIAGAAIAVLKLTHIDKGGATGKALGIIFWVCASLAVVGGLTGLAHFWLSLHPFGK